MPSRQLVDLPVPALASRRRLPSSARIFPQNASCCAVPRIGLLGSRGGSINSVIGPVLSPFTSQNKLNLPVKESVMG
jgi:hypothetical protein